MPRRPTSARCATAATRARRRRRPPAQRRALRRQLGSGLGLRGALRAWWALPPLPPRSAQGSSSPSVHSEVGMDSAYDLFMNGTALLDNGDFHAAVVPLARARDLEPDKASVREALGRALFGAAPLPRGGGRVRGRRRARADQRLRALLPRPVAAAAGPPRRGAQAAGARIVPAPGARGLLEVPRSGPPPRGLSTPGFRPVAVALTVLSCRYSFRGRPPAGVVESGRSPAFLLSGRRD